MDNLVNRFLAHWKTTVGGLLSVSGVVFMVLAPNYPGAKWVRIGTGIVAGLTGLLAKDN